MSCSLVIKNTFISVKGAEALSPPSLPLCRAKTDSFRFPEEACPSTDDEASPSSSGASDHEAAGVVPTADPETCDEVTAARAPRACCRSLRELLDAGGEEAAEAIREVSTSVCELAFDAAGSDLVLRALELASTEEARGLAVGLQGILREAARSANAGPVLEAVVGRLGAEGATLVAERLLPDGIGLALSLHGSSVLCCALAHCSADARVAALADVVLSTDLAALCSHKFGHSVATAILCSGLPHQRAAILAALGDNVQRFARHRYSSLVLNRALLQCSAWEREHLAAKVLEQHGAVIALACHVFGVDVVRALLQVPSVSHRVQGYLRKGAGRLLRDKYGKELLLELGIGSGGQATTKKEAYLLSGRSQSSSSYSHCCSSPARMRSAAAGGM